VASPEPPLVSVPTNTVSPTAVDDPMNPSGMAPTHVGGHEEPSCVQARSKEYMPWLPVSNTWPLSTTGWVAT